MGKIISFPERKPNDSSPWDWPTIREEAPPVTGGSYHVSNTYPPLGCPECERTDGYLNIGANHWGLCDQHKTCWAIGCNLFSGWQEEDEERWRANEELLQEYEEVEPFMFRGDVSA